MPVSAFAGDVLNSYLAEASGDSTVAIAQMESDILLFSGEVVMLETDVKKATSRGDRYAAEFKEEQGNWFDKLWASDAIKTILFGLGVWLGTYASK
jgi:hypothetical protein